MRFLDYFFNYNRFVILALVPRDLLHQLPVPKRIRTYLDTPFYYSETIADWTVPGNDPLSSSRLSNDVRVETNIQNSDEHFIPISSSINNTPSSPNAAAGSGTDNQTYHSENQNNVEDNAKITESSTLRLPETLQNIVIANESPNQYSANTADTNSVQSTNISVTTVSTMSVENTNQPPRETSDPEIPIEENCDDPMNRAQDSFSRAPP